MTGFPSTSTTPVLPCSKQGPIWTKESTLATDCTFHQLAPYIGRMKTSMARSLIDRYTDPGDLLVDPFCGSGVVALEAALGNRQVIAGDWNSYAVLLTRAKLFAPPTIESANLRLQEVWEGSRQRLMSQDLRRIPKWVRAFFHPETLRSALAFRDECVQRHDDFLLACLLGILHHQRPGFLSYPSSHLVPYLRTKNFPRDAFPEMYEQRDVLHRLQSKLRRTYRRPPAHLLQRRWVVETDARLFPPLREITTVITSPPYMNELHYVRDNRLRLWFHERRLPRNYDPQARDRERSFSALLTKVCTRIGPKVLPGGRIVLVLGDSTRGRRRPSCTATLAHTVFDTEPMLKEFHLEHVYEDKIPDIRRSRRKCKGTKNETVLVFRKP